MRKWSKSLIFSLFVISMLFPLIPFSVKAQSTIPTFTVGACGPAPIGNWDGISFAATTGDYFRYNALEGLFELPYGAESGDYNNLVPLLATSWTIHSRPDEMNAKGFMNYGGVDYMDVVLRENVKFHDGSDWNATVCKWNLDRHMYTLGNIDFCLGGTVDSAVTANRPIYWMDYRDWDDYATASWNVTKLRGPGPYTYGYLNEYPGFGTSSLYDVPYGYNRFPRFTNITILDNKQSGGTVRVYFNDWGTGPQYLSNAWIKFISMDSYKAYFDVPIMGYGDVPKFPQNNATSPFPGHLIGTGPYMFDNFTLDQGTMTRFDDWWNSSAQQAKGWHKLPKVAVVMFSHDITGYNARTTALVTGDIDFAYDHSWEPLGYSDIATVSNLDYIDMGQENYGEVIVLNCVDETYLRYWDDIDLNLTAYGILSSTNIKETNGTLKPTHGVDRAFRKALSYAYDYDTYLALFNGRLVRSGGLVAGTHEYYDPSVPLPYRDLTIARQTLLDDPVWGPICAARGLTSTTDDWNTVAGTNPIYTFEDHYDQAHLESYQVLISALEDIGCAIDATEDTIGTYPAILAGELPLLSCDAFAIKPYHSRIDDLGFIQAYYQSTGIIERTPSGATFPYVPYGRFIADYNSYPYAFPYKGGSNMGFSYNATCDSLIAKLWFQNATGEQEYYSELADWAQNYQYPMLYLGNDLTGRAVNDDWDTAWHWILVQHFDLVKYSPTAPRIPGFSVGLVLFASVIASIGFAYIFMRRKKII
ncbi:MAG: ABC transporter substrate-binding protein [Candidatus Thorarchaeota archaeon]